MENQEKKVSWIKSGFENKIKNKELSLLLRKYVCSISKIAHIGSIIFNRFLFKILTHEPNLLLSNDINFNVSFAPSLISHCFRILTDSGNSLQDVDPCLQDIAKEMIEVFKFSKLERFIYDNHIITEIYDKYYMNFKINLWQNFDGRQKKYFKQFLNFNNFDYKLWIKYLLIKINNWERNKLNYAKELDEKEIPEEIRKFIYKNKSWLGILEEKKEKKNITKIEKEMENIIINEYWLKSNPNRTLYYLYNVLKEIEDNNEKIKKGEFKLLSNNRKKDKIKVLQECSTFTLAPIFSIKNHFISIDNTTLKKLDILLKKEIMKKNTNNLNIKKRAAKRKKTKENNILDINSLPPMYQDLDLRQTIDRVLFLISLLKMTKQKLSKEVNICPKTLKLLITNKCISNLKIYEVKLKNWLYIKDKEIIELVNKNINNNEEKEQETCLYLPKDLKSLMNINQFILWKEFKLSLINISAETDDIKEKNKYERKKKRKRNNSISQNLSDKANISRNDIDEILIPWLFKEDIEFKNKIVRKPTQFNKKQSKRNKSNNGDIKCKLWQEYFNLDKLLTKNQIKKGYKFANHIETDGSSICFMMETPGIRLSKKEMKNKRTHKKQKIELEDNKYNDLSEIKSEEADRTIAIDPGRTNIIYSVESNKNTSTKHKIYKFTRKQYYQQSGINKRKELTEKWRENDNMNIIDNEFSKCTIKTAREENWSQYLKTYNKYKDKLWKHKQQLKYGRLKFRSYILRNKCLDGFLASWYKTTNKVTLIKERITEKKKKNGKFRRKKKKIRIKVKPKCQLELEMIKNHKPLKPLIAYGDGSFNSTGKGEVSVPNKRIFNKCRRYYKTILVNEHKTTILCSCCHQRLCNIKYGKIDKTTKENIIDEKEEKITKNIKKNSNIKIETLSKQEINKEEAKDNIEWQSYPLRGLKWCRSTNCSFKYVNRDKNAAINILQKYHALRQNQDYPNNLIQEQIIDTGNTNNIRLVSVILETK